MTALFVAVFVALQALVLAARALPRRGRAAAALRRLQGGRGPAPRPVRVARGLPFPLGYLDRRLAEGALGVRPRSVLLVALGGALGCFACASLVLGPGWPADLAIVGGLVVPLAWLHRVAARRREAIALEMERVADGLVGAVSAGLVPYEALLDIGVSAGGILGPELLRTVADADRIGLSEALLLLRTRLPLPEVRLLVAALRLNLGAGAELAASLRGLHQTLRDRRETAAALAAATASGRYQAGLLVAVPPLLLAFMRLLYPAFEAPLFGTPSGRALLVLAGAWVCAGYLVVRRMSVPREVG